ncbi:MAG: hypothetical protein V5A28_01350 [Haloarculaceae archaeon]
MTDRVPGPGGRRARLRRWGVVVLAVAVLCSTAVPAVAAASDDGGQTPLTSDRQAVDAAPVAQQDDPLTVCDRNVTGFTDAFNSGSEQVPAFVRARISDSDVHLAVEGEGGGDFTLVTDDDSRIVSSSAGEPASPSVRVITDCETFRNITDAANPGSQFRTAYANDRVRFVGVDAVNWLFFTTLETVTDPISLAVVLFLFLVLLVVAYIVVRRATSVVRGGRVDNRGGDGDGGGSGGSGGGRG